MTGLAVALLILSWLGAPERTVASAGERNAGKPSVGEPMELLIIDDFPREARRSALGTEWRFFTDGVMGGGPFDASGYRGLRIAVSGDGGAYFLHLRTEDTVLPWQYYQASFAAKRPGLAEVSLARIAVYR